MLSVRHDTDKEKADRITAVFRRAMEAKKTNPYRLAEYLVRHEIKTTADRVLNVVAPTEKRAAKVFSWFMVWRLIKLDVNKVWEYENFFAAHSHAISKSRYEIAQIARYADVLRITMTKRIERLEPDQRGMKSQVALLLGLLSALELTPKDFVTVEDERAGRARIRKRRDYRYRYRPRKRVLSPLYLSRAETQGWPKERSGLFGGWRVGPDYEPTMSDAELAMMASADWGATC
jgi:hypothetical protein